MRSILKSHKRNDSLSDPNNALEAPHIRTHVKRIGSSPKLEQFEKFASPMVGSQLQQSSLSSPKKLLSPIKKMFGHHSKPVVAPPSNDTLQSLMRDDSGPNSKKETLRRNQGPSAEVSDLQYPDVVVVNPEESMRSSPSQEDTQKLSLGFKTKSMRSAEIRESHCKNEQSQWSRENESKLESPSVSVNTSNLSISTSRSSLRVPAIKKETSKADGSEMLHNSDEDSKDSDTSSQSSSQFSFVRDMRGGRNTSVKYYKTKPPCSASDGETTQYFNIDDMGFEADGLSDYDFENNGIDDEGDFEDEYQDGSNRYDDFVSEDDPGRNHRNEGLGELAISSLRSPGYAGDFLDTYLEARSPTKSFDENIPGRSHSSDPFTVLHSTPSPIDAGLGISLIEMPGDSSSEPESLEAVTSMMDTLKRLEGSPKSHKEQQAKHSLDNAVETQGSFDHVNPEGNFSADSRTQKDRIDKRKSVADMMAMLSFLEHDPSKAQSAFNESAINSTHTSRPTEKRYSWLTNEDSFSQNEPNRLPNGGDSNYDALEQDLLDEVNLVPENFEFSDEDRTAGDNKPNFLRSNSYNKKPTKVAPSYTSEEKKLELRSKTVTFFRSKSLEFKDKGRIKDITRAASVRSATSFNDEDISEGDEEAYSDFQETTMNQY